MVISRIEGPEIDLKHVISLNPKPVLHTPPDGVSDS